MLNWTLNGVSVWLIATLPLVIGVAAGYLYHLPARMHHFSEHMRHRGRVHELEHELRELKSSLDKVLMMPEDGTTPIEANLLPEPARAAVEPEDDRGLHREPVAAELLAAPAKKKVSRARLSGVELTQPVAVASADRPRRNGKTAPAKRSRPRSEPAAETAAS